MLWPKALLVWLLLMCAETVHGILRRATLVPRLGERRANRIGMFTGSAIILAITFVLIDWIGATDAWRLLAIGCLWSVLTLAFEVGLGRLAMGYSWDRIAGEFDPRRGGLMAFGLLFMAISPLLASRLHAILR